MTAEISPRPWSTHEKFHPNVSVRDADGRLVLWDDSASGDGRPDIEHAVACVNAIHAAGVTPEAVAADQDLLRKLVEAAREVVRAGRDAAHVLNAQRLHEDAYPISVYAEGLADALSALRAAGRSGEGGT